MPEQQDDSYWDVKVAQDEMKLTTRKWIKLRIDPPYPDSETAIVPLVHLMQDGSNQLVEAHAGAAATGPTVKLEDAGGQGKIELKVGQNTITIDMQKIEFKVGGNTITLTQSGIEIKGVQIAIQGQAKVETKAPMIQTSADAMLQLKGGGMAELKGGVVMIN